MCCSHFDSTNRRLTDDYVTKHRNCLPIKGYDNASRLSFPVSNVRLSNESAACKYNATPNFLALDSGLYTELAARFGINPVKQSMSRLALVDLSDESYYIMKGQFNKSNIGKSFTHFRVVHALQKSSYDYDIHDIALA